MPTCSPTLLVVVLHRLADGVMDDESHVRLVDAHSKGHSGHNHLQEHRHGPTRQSGRDDQAADASSPLTAAPSTSSLPTSTCSISSQLSSGPPA